MRKSVQLALAATFAALHVVLYFISFGPWRNWAIYIAPIEAILLGPGTGFLTAFLGSSIARMIKPDALWMFGIIAEPVSVLMAGFLTKTKWKPVLAAYAIMLFAYFAHPFGTLLPLWTVLDVLLAMILIYPAAKSCNNLPMKNIRQLAISLVLVSFVCVATDSLVRVFLLIPGGLSGLFFGSFDVLYAEFVAGAMYSYFEDVVVVAISITVAVPLVATVFRQQLFGQRFAKEQEKEKEI